MADDEAKTTAIEDLSVDDRLAGKAFDDRDIALAKEFNRCIVRMFPEGKISSAVIAVATATIIVSYPGQIEDLDTRRDWFEQWIAGVRSRLGIGVPS